MTGCSGPGHRSWLPGVSRTFTFPAVIARFAMFLDGRPPAPQSLVDGLSCAPAAGSVCAPFTSREKHGPAVTVSAFSQTAVITVNGKPQPLL